MDDNQYQDNGIQENKSLLINTEKQIDLLKDDDSLDSSNADFLNGSYQENFEFKQLDTTEQRNLVLVETLKERNEMIQAQEMAGDERVVGRYKPVNKGKKGRNKRQKDEERLEKLKKDQAIVRRANHRSLRVVEKWNGTYDKDKKKKSTEDQTPVFEADVQKAVAACLKWVPSVHMAEEKYLADHTEEIKKFFQDSLFLEQAMANPKYTAYFVSLDESASDVLRSNLDMAKDLREICTKKLYMMGVKLEAHGYDDISVSFLEEEDVFEQMDTERSLGDLKKHMFAKQMRENTENAVRLQILEAEQNGKKLTVGEKYKLRDDAAMELRTEVMDKLKMHLEKEGVDAGGGNWRTALQIAAMMIILTGMPLEDAAEIGKAVSKEPLKTNGEPNPGAQKYIQAVESVMEYIGKADLSLFDKMGTMDMFSIGTGDYMQYKLLALFCADMDKPMRGYEALRKKKPEYAKLSKEDFVEAKARRNYATSVFSVSECLYKVTFNEDYMKSHEIDDLINMSEEQAEKEVTELMKHPGSERYMKQITAYSDMRLYTTQRKAVTIGDHKASVEAEKQQILREEQESLERERREAEEKRRQAEEKANLFHGYDQSFTTKYTSAIDRLTATVDKGIESELRGEKGISALMFLLCGYTEEQGVDFIKTSIKGSKKTATDEEKKLYAQSMEKTFDEVKKLDLSVLEKVKKDGVFRLSEEEYVRAATLYSAAMAYDSELTKYGSILKEHPDFCGYTKEQFIEIQAILKSIQAYGTNIPLTRLAMESPATTEKLGGLDYLMNMSSADAASLIKKHKSPDEQILISNFDLQIEIRDRNKSKNIQEEIQAEKQRLLQKEA